VLSPQSALILFAAAATLAVVGQLLVLRDALAGRTPAASATTASRAREVLWIAIPALALALVVFGTWRALPRRDVPPASIKAAPITRTVAAPLAPTGR
jgi:heme/copper-type cytochrome/quinol oxidase subunit 2